MPQSYVLTDNELQIRNTRNLQAEEFISFHTVNPVAQALSDCLVTGPGLIPGICAAAVCLQANQHVNSSLPEAFYYTLQEAVFALRAARPASLPLMRTAATISLLISELAASNSTPQFCCKALRCLHDIICFSIDRDEAQMRPFIESVLPKGGSIAAAGGYASLHSVSRGTLGPVLIDTLREGRPVPRVYSPQGLPLTESRYGVKELQEAGCTADLVTDSGLAGIMMREGCAALFLTAIRVCANGDVQAAAGATGLAATAKAAGIPVYVIAHRHVFDASCSTGFEAPMEEYVPQQKPADGALSRQPFVGPVSRDWVTGFITCRGIFPPSDAAALSSCTQAADGLHLSTASSAKNMALR